MSDISISAARTKQLDETVKSLLTVFDQPVGSGQSREQFTAVFHPDIQWRDHAFLVCRVGHEAVIRLNQAWLHCNQPFKTELKVCSAASQKRRLSGLMMSVLLAGC